MFFIFGCSFICNSFLHFFDTLSNCKAISACEKGGQWLAALDLLCDTATRRVELNTISYSAAISACASSGHWLAALQLLRDMEAAGVEANTITYGATITASQQGGHWMTALSLLGEMKAAKVEASTTTYNAAVTACEKGDHWVAALAVLDEMTTHAADKDVITFSSLISACEKAGSSQYNKTLTSNQTATNWCLLLLLFHLVCCWLAHYHPNPNPLASSEVPGFLGSEVPRTRTRATRTRI
ncbi:unnamed protein product [Polarella glacialis]|uniref:PROP1-like PPR domain-containing protein n=1 Tax=Polarella glacialis TaxID=89957 RepID=A0A813DXB8_POLGL|nr:unnamed protein product [Polarella glacialis]